MTHKGPDAQSTYHRIMSGGTDDPFIAFHDTFRARTSEIEQRNRTQQQQELLGPMDGLNNSFTALKETLAPIEQLDPTYRERVEAAQQAIDALGAHLLRMSLRP